MPVTASIIIVTYNNIAHIQNCLDALYETASDVIEIIVYDNCSQDGTCELIQQTYPQVKLIKSATNIGFAAANNQAADLAQADSLVFLNPDTVVQPNWLRPLLSVLQNEGVGAATSQLLLLGMPDHINACGNEMHLSGITYCRFLGQPKLVNAVPVSIGAISGAAFMMKKAVFKQMGGFEQNFFMYYEDTDLSLRLRLAGLTCVAVPDSQIMHDYRSQFSAAKLYYLERNRLLSLLSLLPGRILLMMLPSLLFMECVSWGYAFLQGSAGIKSKFSAWASVWENRAWVKQRRSKYAHVMGDYDFIWQGFSPNLDVQYVRAELAGLIRLVEWGAWLTAMPAQVIARICIREKG